MDTFEKYFFIIAGALLVLCLVALIYTVGFDQGINHVKAACNERGKITPDERCATAMRIYP